MTDEEPLFLAERLREIGFTPSRYPYSGSTYPFTITINGDCGVTAELTSPRSERSIGELKAFLNTYITSVPGYLWGGCDPTFALRLLGMSMPAKSGFVKREDKIHFENYERLLLRKHGLREKNGNCGNLVGIIHMRSTLDVNIHYRPYLDDPYQSLPFGIDIFDIWVADNTGELVNATVDAVLNRFRAHAMLLDGELQGWPPELGEGSGCTPILIPILKYRPATPHLKSMSASIARGILDSPSFLDGYDMPSDYGVSHCPGTFEHVEIASYIQSRPFSEDEVADFERAFAQGTVRPARAALPKSQPGRVHSVCEALSSELVIRDGHVMSIFDPEAIEGGTPLQWRILVDLGTNAFYAEPVFSEKEYQDLIGFLQRAWAEKEGHIFRGKPETLLVPKSKIKLYPNLSKFVASNSISLSSASTGGAAGVHIARLWSQETPWRFSEAGRYSYKRLIDWSTAQQLVTFGEAFCNGNYDEIVNLFGRSTFRHPRINKIDVQRFLGATGQVDAIQRIQKYWPTPGDKEE